MKKYKNKKGKKVAEILVFYIETMKDLWRVT